MARYTAAPIQETLIDIRVKPLGSEMLGKLEALHAIISSDYPQRDERQPFSAKLGLHEGKISEASSTLEPVDGYLHRSSDGKKVVQFRLDGFTFNQMRPYESWGAFFGEGMRLWKIYQREIGLHPVVRIAVRTINLIHVPGDIINLAEYFTVATDVKTTDETVTENFVFRTQLRFSRTGVRAAVSFAPGSTGTPTGNTFILDTDVFFEKEVPSESDEIGASLGLIRVVKNDIFENMLQPKTKLRFGDRLE